MHACSGSAQQAMLPMMLVGFRVVSQWRRAALQRVQAAQRLARPSGRCGLSDKAASSLPAEQPTLAAARRPQRGRAHDGGRHDGLAHHRGLGVDSPALVNGLRVNGPGLVNGLLVRVSGGGVGGGGVDRPGRVGRLQDGAGGVDGGGLGVNRRRLLVNRRRLLVNRRRLLVNRRRRGVDGASRRDGGARDAADRVGDEAADAALQAARRGRRAGCGAGAGAAGRPGGQGDGLGRGRPAAAVVGPPSVLRRSIQRSLLATWCAARQSGAAAAGRREPGPMRLGARSRLGHLQTHQP